MKNKNVNLVLASMSGYKAEIMSLNNLKFTAISSILSDEEESKIASDFLQGKELNLQTASDVVKLLALKKAKDVAHNNNTPNTWYIGADSTILFDNKFLEKYKSIEEAKEMVFRLFNNTHHVLTGFAIVDNELKTIQHFTDITEINPEGSTREKSDAWVDTYGKRCKTFCGYTMDSESIERLKIKNSQMATVKGLPIEKLMELL